MRKQYVDVVGTIGSGGLTNVATTHTFTAPLTYANGTTLPTLTGADTFLLSIKNSAGRVEEIIEVTAYNQTTGVSTIARAKEGTTAVAHLSGDKVTISSYPSDFLGTAPNALSTKTTTYTAVPGDWLKADATAGAFVITLPSDPSRGSMVTIQKIDATVNIVTVDPAGSGTIHGDPTATLESQWASVTVQHQGSDVWSVVSSTVGPVASAYEFSADARPASPNPKDDEDDGTSLVTWTATPTAAAFLDRTSRPGSLHIQANSGSTFVGEYQPIPASFPFTVVTKVARSTGAENYQRAGGLLFAPASPTGASSIVYFGLVHDTNLLTQRTYQTNFGTTHVVGSTGFKHQHGIPVFLKAVFTSATAVTFSVSWDGVNYIVNDNNYTVPFSVGVMGRAIANEGGSASRLNAFFDYFRVT